MITNEGLTPIINFMTPGVGILMLGCGYISHIVKMHYCFKNLSPLLSVIDQTNYVYSKDDQGRVYQNCKFHISRYSEYVFSSSLSIYFKLIAIVLQDYDAAFLYHC